VTTPAQRWGGRYAGTGPEPPMRHSRSLPAVRRTASDYRVRPAVEGDAKRRSLNVRTQFRQIPRNQALRRLPRAQRPMLHRFARRASCKLTTCRRRASLSPLAPDKTRFQCHRQAGSLRQVATQLFYRPADFRVRVVSPRGKSRRAFGVRTAAAAVPPRCPWRASRARVGDAGGRRQPDEVSGRRGGLCGPTSGE
jgi:hypothetical protein